MPKPGLYGKIVGRLSESERRGKGVYEDRKNGCASNGGRFGVLSKRLIFCGLLVGIVIGIFIFPLIYGSEFVLLNNKILGYLVDCDLIKFYMYLPSTPFNLRVMDNLTHMMHNGFESSNNEGNIIYENPGKFARKAGWKARHPIFIIPGITSIGLELWEGHECSGSNFRERFWGSFTMVKFLLLDKSCWIKHIMLDKNTGLDPHGIKIRPANGLGSADFLIPGYWVWGKIIEALGSIGYEPSNLSLASYDWRLSMENMEVRDKFFSRLKTEIEFSFKTNNNHKIVILTHSFGSIVWNYFMKWVESRKGGNGGDHWIDMHINNIVNIAGPFLGVPKTLSVLLSGETKDTAQLGTVESYLLEIFFSRRERISIFRSWPSLISMIPKGGNLVWGNSTHSPDSCTGQVDRGTSSIIDAKVCNVCEMINMKGASGNIGFSVDEIVEKLKNPFLFPRSTFNVISKHVFGNYKGDINASNLDDPKYWQNPFTYKLPNAPSLKIHVFYGIGKPTERSYTYVPNKTFMFSFYSNFSFMYYKDESRKTELGINLEQKHKGTLDCDVVNYDCYDPYIIIDSSENDIGRNIVNGVRMSDGDGTVPLLSLGLMSVKGWKTKTFNPYNVRVITREYEDSPKINSLYNHLNIRGGPHTSEHVDILGNFKLTLDILQIVSGNDESSGTANNEDLFRKDNIDKEAVMNYLRNPDSLLKDQISSDIVELSERIDGSLWE